MVARDPSQLPLAERLRPKTLEDFLGQSRILSQIRPFVERPERLPNLIFWGPPGSGKTTLARLLATRVKGQFVNLNAVETGAKEIRQLGEQAHFRKIQNELTVVFIDEIHRLNRSQQDVLLPFTESGDFVLIGATTENPSYELNAALLSRARVLVFNRLTDAELKRLLVRGAEELNTQIDQLLAPAAQDLLIGLADGDGRRLLTTFETIFAHRHDQPLPLDENAVSTLLGDTGLRYDKKSDEHYDTISAFIKSVRGSDPDAAVYYLARMLKGGEDPVFIARRLVILASEDVGNADPRALQVAVAGLQAVELVGMPEAAINLSQIVTYLSCAPKSNASYNAIKAAQAKVEETGTLPIPLALRSANTRLMRELGYGEGYKYAHDGKTGWQDMQFLPDELRDVEFYRPSERGFEKTMRQYLDWMKGKKTDD